MYTDQEYAVMAAKANDENKVLSVKNGEFLLEEQPIVNNTSLTILNLEYEAQKLLPSIQAGIDAEVNQERLIHIMLEIESLKGNID